MLLCSWCGRETQSIACIRYSFISILCCCCAPISPHSLSGAGKRQLHFHTYAVNLFTYYIVTVLVVQARDRFNCMHTLFIYIYIEQLDLSWCRKETFNFTPTLYIYIYLSLMSYNSHVPQQQSAEPRNSAGAEALAVARLYTLYYCCAPVPPHSQSGTPLPSCIAPCSSPSTAFTAPRPAPLLYCAQRVNPSFIHTLLMFI